MGKPGLSFGLNVQKKKPGPPKPALSRSKPVFGGDDESDDDSRSGAAAVQELGGDFDLASPRANTSRNGPKSKTALPAQPPSLKSKSQSKPVSGDLSSALASRKNAEAAADLDPSVYEYDSVYDSLKPQKQTTKEDVERKPKYMKSLLQAAEVRKRDALIAEEKKIAREREAEGEEFADKEKFVTEAYKRQQEENRRLEEEEKRREEAEAKKNEGGGMSAFYRKMLDRDEERHAQVVKAAEERAKLGPKEPESGNGVDEEEDDEKTQARLAQELNEKGAGIVVNEDGQVVDKRQLLQGGLNVGAKKKEAVQKEKTERGARDGDRGQFNGGNAANRKQAMRERQSRMLEEQLEQTMKRSRESDEAQRTEVERASKSRKTEGEISSAKERYLARKRAAEEAKSKGVAE
ncbi:coiled-coil domain-containing protein 55 [Purpureocillium lavendulum]|uniref:Coiled-coil domain-containing protein 55 n=1 Tax=Purpureocillium lavendulum TaxID=1247861 RepID=A0AB34G4A9_9HYPO|nr:coiled-coil domain-containing protein 55 [Purpureocillium lavendulum]